MTSVSKCPHGYRLVARGPRGCQNPAHDFERADLQHAGAAVPEPRGAHLSRLRLGGRHRRRDALRLRLPEGPLTVVDEIGAAQVRDLLAARYAETGDHLHQPADLLEKLVAEGPRSRTKAAAAGESTAPEFKHDITKVGVVGTGTMASGIVQVFAQAGYESSTSAAARTKLDRVVGYITKNLDRAIARAKAPRATRTRSWAA